MLADLGITKTHLRPYTSNDNPYSESQFRTMKYRPEFPDRFGSIQDARAFCRRFFDWYNNQHHHSGIGLLTPGQVHSGQAGDPRSSQIVLDAANARHPDPARLDHYLRLAQVRLYKGLGTDNNRPPRSTGRSTLFGANENKALPTRNSEEPKLCPTEIS